MKETVIKVENLSKQFQLGYRTAATLRSFVSERSGERADSFFTLSDINFEVKKGEVLGIIGSNGAGKSTLLKIISRIILPTSGTVDIKGRVSSLLEVGTGFHHELSGRENIYLNGRILGMTKKEIDAQLDDIIAFSGVGSFIDIPVKNYSSGMYMRLAFSVAAFLISDILLLDEVLSVGDAQFRKKCQEKLTSAISDGTTVILISHNLSLIEEVCDHVILLSKGKIVQQGKTAEVVQGYKNALLHGENSEGLAPQNKEVVWLNNCSLLDQMGNTISKLERGQALIFQLELESKEDLKQLDVCIHLRDEKNQILTIMNASDESFHVDLQAGEKKTVMVHCAELLLMDKGFFVDVNIRYGFKNSLYFRYGVLYFEVLQSAVPGLQTAVSDHRGSIQIPARWESKYSNEI